VLLHHCLGARKRAAPHAVWAGLQTGAGHLRVLLRVPAQHAAIAALTLQRLPRAFSTTVFEHERCRHLRTASIACQRAPLTVTRLVGADDTARPLAAAVCTCNLRTAGHKEAPGGRGVQVGGVCCKVETTQAVSRQSAMPQWQPVCCLLPWMLGPCFPFRISACTSVSSHPSCPSAGPAAASHTPAPPSPFPDTPTSWPGHCPNKCAIAWPRGMTSLQPRDSLGQRTCAQSKARHQRGQQNGDGGAGEG
jgi:hypothetical protein